jgi:hypothetical protein
MPFGLARTNLPPLVYCIETGALEPSSRSWRAGSQTSAAKLYATRSVGTSDWWTPSFLAKA